MKKTVLLLCLLIFIINPSFSQSKFSILGKAGGQLLQDLSNKKEIRYIGKAIESASDRTYEMEKIRLQNKKEITIIERPDETNIVVPSEGYKWINAESKKDYNVTIVTEEDKRSYSSAVDMLVKSNEYIYSDDIAMSISYASLSLDMEKTYLGYFMRSFGYTVKGEYNKALADLDNALNFEIDNDMYVTVYNQRASLLTNLGRYEECVRSCNICLKLTLTNNEISSILRNRAQAKLFLNKFDSALNDCNLSLDMNPNNYEAYIVKGMVKLRLEDFNGAIVSYSTPINVYKTKAKLGAHERTFLGQSLIKRAQAYYFNDKYLQGLEDSNTAIKYVDNFGQAYLIRGAIKVKLGLKESAKLDLVKAKELGHPLDDQQIQDILNEVY